MTQVYRSIFFETHYGRAHFACLIIFLIGMLFLMVAYAIEDGIMYNSPSILCVGYIYLKSLVGLGSMGFFLILLTGLGITLLSVFNRNTCTVPSLCMLLWAFMLVAFFSLLLTIVGILSGTGILIEGSNGTFYGCFTVMPRDGVRIIRFLTDIDSMTQSNQTCSLLSKSEICNPVFVLSGNSLPWIDVNGTETALACESLDPEGLNACSRYANALNILCGFQLFFFSCSLSLGVLSSGFAIMGIRRNILTDAYVVHVTTVNSAFIFECSKSVNLYCRESNVSTSCTCANRPKGQLGLVRTCFSLCKGHSYRQEKDHPDPFFMHGSDIHLWP